MLFLEQKTSLTFKIYLDAVYFIVHLCSNNIIYFLGVLYEFNICYVSFMITNNFIMAMWKQKEMKLNSIWLPLGKHRTKTVVF